MFNSLFAYYLYLLRFQSLLDLFYTRSSIFARKIFQKRTNRHLKRFLNYNTSPIHLKLIRTMIKIILLVQNRIKKVTK